MDEYQMTEQEVKDHKLIKDYLFMVHEYVLHLPIEFNPPQTKEHMKNLERKIGELRPEVEKLHDRFKNKRRD